MTDANRTAVVIPAYKPDKRLPPYVAALKEAGIGKIVIVDDGSGEEYQPLFASIPQDEVVHIISYVPNGGKGVVFLNDFTLGKFWEIGPQKRLFIPAPLLKTGENVLRIVETEGKFCGAVLQDEPDLG